MIEGRGGGSTVGKNRKRRLGSVTRLAAVGVQRSMRPLRTRHRAAAFVILTTIFGAENLIVGGGQSGVGSLRPVMMTSRHLR